MPTWRALWAQRLRWQRGAVENLGSYGLRPSVMRYWAQQLGIGYGVVAIAAYLLLVVVMVLAPEPVGVVPVLDRGRSASSSSNGW